MAQRKFFVTLSEGTAESRRPVVATDDREVVDATLAALRRRLRETDPASRTDGAASGEKPSTTSGTVCVRDAKQ